MRCLASFLAIFISFLSCTPAFAADYFVRKSGNDRNSGMNKDQAFATVGQAVSVSSGNDRVFIGAGTYQEYVAKNIANSGSSLQIIGDTSGSQTGDKGRVSLTSSPNRYAIYLYGGGSIVMENITFASDRIDAKGYGPYVRTAAKAIEFRNCQFENLVYSLRVDSAQSLSIQACEFRNSLYGVLTTTCKSVVAEDNSFANCYYGIYTRTSTTTDISKSKWYTDNTTTGEYTPYAAVRCTGGSLNVHDVSIDGTRIGIYGTALSKASVSSSVIKNLTSYGVLAQGDYLAASKLEIEGAGQRGWGLSLESTVERPTIESCRLTNLTGGLYARGLPCKHSNVVSSGNYYGLYVPSQILEYHDSDMSGLEISENRIGLYSLRNAKETKKMSLRGLTATKNTYGLLIYNDADVQSCKLTENMYGLSIYYAGNASVNECTIVGSDADLARSEGLRIRADNVKISQVVCKNNRLGIRLDLTSANPPKLSNVQAIANMAFGMYVTNGALSLGTADNVKVDGGIYGLYTTGTNVDVNGWVPTNCDYPFSFYYGTASVKNVSFSSVKQPLRSQFQTNLSVAGFAAKGSQSNALYIYRTENVSLTKCYFGDGLGNGLVAYDPVSFRAQGIEATSNKSYGFYVRATSEPKEFSVSESRFADNGYGMYTSGVPCNPETLNNSQVSGNRYGLRVYDAAVELSEKSKLSIQDNYYGISSVNGKLTINDFSLDNNYVGVHAQNSPLRMANSKISSTGYGAILYAGDSTIESCAITGGVYGVYFSPRTLGTKLEVRETEISGTSSSAVYATKGGSLVPNVYIADVNISKTGYGVFANSSNIEAEKVTVDSPSRYAIYQNGGKHAYEDFSVTGGGSWAVYSSGDSFSMRRGVISSRYGVYLRSTSSQLVNSVVKDSYYGVYANNPVGKYEILQSTIGNISTYGVFLANGQMSVTNTIVDSARYGLYKTTSAGDLSHDYNLISAVTSGFVNETAGLHEIEKKPIFVDPLKGDLHLAAGSPAINAGMDLSHISKSDIEGNARPSFRQFEMGAYEFTEHAGSLRILDWAEQAK